MNNVIIVYMSKDKSAIFKVAMVQRIPNSPTPPLRTYRDHVKLLSVTLVQSGTD